MTDAKPMASFLQKMGFHRTLRFSYGVHQAQGIFNRHGTIVEGMHCKYRRGVHIHVVLGRPALYFGIGRILAQ